MTRAEPANVFKMATKEVKTSLRNARECIKNKDYKEALKHCKAVLKADKTNYTALVFFGKCASELNQPDQAYMAYKKAIESDETQLLAWQGLAALSEKEDNPQLNAELPEVYTKLLHMYESDKVKWMEVATKLAEFHDNQGEFIKAAEIWEEIAIATENTAEQLKIWTGIVGILEKRPLEESGIKKLQAAYEKVVHGNQSQEPNKQLEIHFENYLRFLVKHQVGEDDELFNDKRQKICNEAKSMMMLFPTSTFALELLGKDFLQSLITAPTPEMTDVFQRLCHMKPGSGIGMLGLGSVLLHQKEFLMARALLQKGLQAFSDCPFGWLSFCQSQLSLHDYQGAVKSAKKGLDCINSSTPDNRQKLQRMLSLAKAEALQKQGPATATMARDIYEKLLSDVTAEEEVDTLTGLGQTLLTLGDITQATQICAKALSIDKSYPSALALQGQISFREGYFDDAELRFLEAIERNKDCAFYYFLLGKLYWEMNGNLRADKKKCLAQFLKVEVTNKTT
ncbi:tetratricopeptide repeat protein 37-like isoform X2 [Orbicella faveolata]|uniref:tetratricopeptide repeat protein 37-like isoform X1 n=1 Tax=Orbicella faveolata TaxID=48498 RepID=UPI0009E2408C|nr:tetratricopeptide repeat protein 37-like isoform X1 [Orbicella faveolata]XP_020629639.1 tetratricopeptide repeat protein 37-like isoform X2 [Orbicella faveolata]